MHQSCGWITLTATGRNKKAWCGVEPRIGIKIPLFDSTVAALCMSRALQVEPCDCLDSSIEFGWAKNSGLARLNSQLHLKTHFHARHRVMVRVKVTEIPAQA